METELIYLPAEPETENKICKVFGCGKVLTREEDLYGSKCAEHSGPQEKLTDIIDKVL